MTELTAFQQQALALGTAGLAVLATLAVLVAIVAGAAFVRGLW